MNKLTNNALKARSVTVLIRNEEIVGVSLCVKEHLSLTCHFEISSKGYLRGQDLAQFKSITRHTSNAFSSDTPYLQPSGYRHHDSLYFLWTFHVSHRKLVHP